MDRRGFIAGAAALAASPLACASAPRVRPVTRPDPACFNACGPGPRHSLSILTWNVFMMPPWVGESPRNEPRASSIAAALLERDFDILCLQKVFDDSAREILQAALAARYPYRYGPANNGWSLKLNSGVWVLSRHPLADYQEITFSDCANVECLSRKGAVLLSGTCGRTPFRLVTTHLQGEEGPTFTEKHQRIRDQQMSEMQRTLIAPHLEAGVPYLVCGDLGTPRFADTGGGETPAYQRMLSAFGATNGPEPHITLDDSLQHNQLARDRTGRRNELDYILLRANGCPIVAERATHVFKRSGWDSSSPGRSDLSYRYGLSARLTFGASET